METAKGEIMQRLWTAVLISLAALVVLAFGVASQQNADVQAVAEIQIDVPAITGTHVITVPLQVSIPVSGDQETLVTIDVAVNLRVTDALTLPALAASPAVTVLPSPTPTSTPTATPAPTTATVNANANVRMGPGTSFATVGTLQAGQEVEVVAVNEAGDWYQLGPGQWIAAFLVDNAPEDLPIAEPEITTTPTSTATPRPTSTPTAEPESESALSVEEYSALVGQAMDDMATGIIEIGELIQATENADPDTWVLQMGARVAMIRMAHSNLQEVTPPAEVAHIHEATLSATSDCNTAMDYLVEGIDNVDEASILTAMTLMISCSQKIEAPAQMWEEYNAGQ